MENREREMTWNKRRKCGGSSEEHGNNINETASRFYIISEDNKCIPSDYETVF